jgi:enoyl-CoA hydratase
VPEAPVRLEVRDGVAVVTLSDPDRRNALTTTMVEGIGQALDDAEGHPDVRVIVVTGVGSAFCAGGDLAALAAAADGDFGAVRVVYEGFLRVARSPLPTIAAVNGPAVGAGFNLALACDVRLAGRSAAFEARFTDMHLHPGGGHSWLLTRAVGRQAATMVTLLGERLDADLAVRHGLAWAAYDDDRLLDAAVGLGSRLAGHEPDYVRTLVATLRAAETTAGHQDALRLESVAQQWSSTRPAYGDNIRALRDRVQRRRE